MTRLFGRRQRLLVGSAGAIAVVCLTLLPVAPRIGYALQTDVCDRFGTCQTAALMTDACAADTRSAVSGQASTPVYFEQVVPGKVGLRFFADGSAGVVAPTDAPRDPAIAQSHRFPHGESALRWLVARNPAESHAIDQAWGPTAARQTDAVVSGLGTLGLSARTEAADTSAVVRGTAGTEQVVMTRAEGGGYSVHQTLTLPGDSSARLTGLAAWLGAQSHLVVRTDHDATGVPTSVTLTGPARAGWDLRVLTGTEPTTDPTGPEAPTTHAFSLRSYTLDLSQRQNAEAFAKLFTARRTLDGRSFPGPPDSSDPVASASGAPSTPATAGSSESVDEEGEPPHPVSGFADRIRSDGLFVETTYEGAAAGADALTAAAVLALLTGAPDADLGGFAPRLTAGSAMDLGRPESDLAPIVNCEVPDDAADAAAT